MAATALLREERLMKTVLERATVRDQESVTARPGACIGMSLTELTQEWHPFQAALCRNRTVWGKDGSKHEHIKLAIIISVEGKHWQDQHTHV